MPETSLQICISKNEIFFDLICPNLNIVMNGHFYKDLGKVKWDIKIFFPENDLLIWKGE